MLRFLEERTFKRVGGLQDIRVDVRVVAATHRDLTQEVRDGKFREDLYYRLQIMPIHLPPLRERRGDVALLAKYFVDSYNREFKKKVLGIVPEALDLLERDPWPGNIRELRNAIERAMLLIDREWLQPEDFATLSRTVGMVAKFKLPAEGNPSANESARRASISPSGVCERTCSLERPYKNAVLSARWNQSVAWVSE